MRAVLRISSRTTRRYALVLVVLVVLVALIALPPGSALAFLALVSVVAIAAVSLRFEPGALMALAVAGTMFSGFSHLLGLPISPDRPLTFLALAFVVVGLPLGDDSRPRLAWRPIHTWMLVTVAAVVCLGLSNDSFAVDVAVFALLDRLGVVPFIAFAIAPILYHDERSRSWLSGTLVTIGWYLGLTAVLEGIGLRTWTWPAYINDPTVGLHFERARGPFAESTGMGLALIGCFIGAIVALSTWRSRLARSAAWGVMPLLLLGALFTLTRAVWMATVVASLVGVVAHPRARRWLAPIVVSGIAGIALALAIVPGLSDQVSERRTERIAVWDRFNSNQAAVEAFSDHPLTGIGWGLFAKRSDPWLWQSDSYPLTGHRIEVHNVLLSRLAEIGLIGTIPWLVVIVLGIAVPALQKPPPQLAAWRIGLLMYASAWATMGAFGPLSTAFPNLLLWLMAGIVAAPSCVRPRLNSSSEAGDVSKFPFARRPLVVERVPEGSAL